GAQVGEVGRRGGFGRLRAAREFGGQLPQHRDAVFAVRREPERADLRQRAVVVWGRGELRERGAVGGEAHQVERELVRAVAGGEPIADDRQQRGFAGGGTPAHQPVGRGVVERQGDDALPVVADRDVQPGGA